MPNVLHLVQGEPLLHRAIGDSSEAVITLHDAGADVDAKDEHEMIPLRCAAMKGDPIIIDILFDVDANPGANNFEGTTPLRLAMQGGHRATSNKLADTIIAKSPMRRPRTLK